MFLGVFVNNCCHEDSWVLKFVGIPQPKPVHGVSPNFQDMLMNEDLELIRFWRGSGKTSCHGNALNIFLS